MMIKNILFIVVLIYASYCDIKTRIIPDKVHVMIILLGLIQVNIVTSILGLLLVPLPFLVVALIKNGTLGGGDIKLVGACSFYLGLSGGLLGSSLGLAFAILVNVLYFRYKGLDDIGKVALVPYLGGGYGVVVMGVI
ncbi:prepilin peptidase [Maledivibacter halophilus]|uniref:Leader peptidase (Prepilin peptidase) / N-methyltransferase n=1 Tax=Maledivibacter halophilus TaxID=36842 RepID=A0A1T5LQ90_9FIRM|nr:prepilin peptidase [Maledivibacter halophilus]SKC77708.1 leader peptidase (prepilin peptidase) / N-methyltransferase [Maledivibacter halophilus]